MSSACRLLLLGLFITFWAILPCTPALATEDSPTPNCLLELKQLSPPKITPKLWESFELIYQIQYTNSCTLNLSPRTLPSSGITCLTAQRSTEQTQNSTTETLHIPCTLQRPGYYFPQPLNLSLHHTDTDTPQNLSLPPTTIAAPLSTYLQSDSALGPKQPLPWPKVLSLKHILALVLLLTLLATAFFYLRKRRKKLALTEPPTLSLEERLRARLNALLSEPCTNAQEQKAFCDELSSILRGYLNDKLQIPAPKSTTSQVASLLHQSPISPDCVQQTLQVLKHADNVKFTTKASTRTQNLEMIQLTLNTVVQIQNELAQPSQSTSPQSAQQ